MVEYTFSYFIQWGFYGLLLYFAYDLKNTLKTMSTSVENLNLKIAVVIEQTESHKEKLDEHSTRIYNLEREK
jgi:chaperonin cofactor prefoldin